ncbi:gag-polypeptide of LTR copia-type domain-containing protein [Phthorimaea operculella]|nr:gag-polypeptide of LTR copia-type domain-containing protein [Phthorimaea operculella]
MSDDNSPSICGIKKLKGSSDYAIWKFATRNYLESKDWYKAVEYEGTELPATLKDTDRKARTTLCLLIEPECYAHVFNATTAKQVWQNLKTAYEDKGWGRRIALQRELWDCRLVNFPNMEKYITKVIFLTQQLSDIDAKVDDDWIISILLSGLTEVYNPLIMAVDNSGTKKLSNIVIFRRIVHRTETFYPIDLYKSNLLIITSISYQGTIKIKPVGEKI